MEDVTEKILKGMNSSATPQTDNPDQPKKVLLLGRAHHELSETIVKICDNRWYVQGEANLLDLADDLSAYPGIPAVAVLDDGKAVGIIVKKDLFSILGRPFGRDVLEKETARKLSQPTASFHVNSNIFSVSSDLGKPRRDAEVRYFLLHADNGSFGGIFSSQDLLQYLSASAEKDLKLARDIQNRIVPELIQHQDDYLEFVSSSTPAMEVGEDFVFIQHHDSRWLFGLCDVSGKGIAASLGATSLWGALQGFDLRRGLSALIQHLNRFMIRTFDQEKFVTGIFFDYQPKTNRLALADLGHGLSYLFHGGKLLKIKTTERTHPLGITEDLDPELFQLALEPSDILLVLSDGLLDQTNTEGDEYDLSRIKRILIENTEASLATLRIRILEDFHAFRGENPLCDDISFLLVRRPA